MFNIIVLERCGFDFMIILQDEVCGAIEMYCSRGVRESFMSMMAGQKK